MREYKRAAKGSHSLLAWKHRCAFCYLKKKKRKKRQLCSSGSILPCGLQAIPVGGGKGKWRKSSPACPRRPVRWATHPRPTVLSPWGELGPVPPPSCTGTGGGTEPPAEEAGHVGPCRALTRSLSETGRRRWRVGGASSVGLSPARACSDL